MLTYAQRIEQAVDYLLLWLQIRAPKDTGNLALNGIRKAYDPETQTALIVIGGEVAPYAIYTNEARIDDRWNGAQNPNQGWIQFAIEEARPVLIMILSGTMTQEDVDALNRINSITLQDSLDTRAISLLGDSTL